LWALEEGYAIRFLKPFFLPGVARIYNQFIKYFNCIQQPRVEMNYSFKDCKPFAPAIDGHNIFIFQLLGSQEVIVMEPPEKTDVETAVVYSF